MKKPVFERKQVPITGTPDPNPEIESRAIAAFRALEAVLNRVFNNHTALNKVRGMMKALEVEMPEMPSRLRETISGSENEGQDIAISYVLASELMVDDLGKRYVARIGVLMIPVAEYRIEMQAKTAEWERHCGQSTE